MMRMPRCESVFSLASSAASASQHQHSSISLFSFYKLFLLDLFLGLIFFLHRTFHNQRFYLTQNSTTYDFLTLTITNFVFF